MSTFCSTTIPCLWSEKQFAEAFPPYYTNFDLAPDGKRFVVLLLPEGSHKSDTNRVTVLLDFFDELPRRAPALR